MPTQILQSRSATEDGVIERIHMRKRAKSRLPQAEGNSGDMKPGTIGWIDLTVEDADSVRAFYEGVVGWRHIPVEMGEYDDFSMQPPGEDAPVTGICHARGVNAGLPPVWIVYFIVENLDESLEVCELGGGRILSGPRSMSNDRYCVIEDPAGAVCALYQRGS